MSKFFRWLELDWKTPSSVRSTINRLSAALRDEGELRHFLSTEKGFRSDQYVYGLLLFHYVAGRDFERAEEADYWLSYAIAQKNQHIEKESYAGWFRPLHCACLWGNIFGVEWLVSHGANINVKDNYGRTPYSCASASFDDTMKKMLCLEEHGYILSQSDFLWAAGNRYSTFEKANEIFHHFVNEKELSVNTIDEKYGKTPVQRACLDGSIFGVEWLMEHNADVNSVTKNGKTPFMLACESPFNRSAKVRYLAENGADCRAKSHEGRTPLLCTCSFSQPSFVVIQQLIELGADLSAEDNNKQNALHFAAKIFSNINKSIIDLLIEKGCDVTCQDKVT
ncbi:serine/threonine-protein phosphatase 6 regulatory ankyrin repeat subunit A-like [Oscarella lobularis]|uniref:serine/threonine-protein phosphatase 6 regulatory ankyrin repeat subunit A-like n=1 Tax=Oscarella lobularis TaxID=121494 RepID=UPI0033133D9E